MLLIHSMLHGYIVALIFVEYKTTSAIIDKPCLEDQFPFEFKGELVLLDCLEFSLFKFTLFGLGLLVKLLLVLGLYPLFLSLSLIEFWYNDF